MSRKVTRRKFMAGTAAGAALATFKFPTPAIAQAAPFKLGLLTVKTGPLAQGGIQMEQGVVTFLKEKNYTFAGRKVDFISADTGGSPAGTKTKAQELIERDKVDAILGPLAAFELLAITDYINEQKTPMLSLAGAEDMTQRRPNPYFLRPSATSVAGHASDGRLRGQGTQAQESRHHHRGLRLRLRADGRLPADLRGERRQDHQQDLAAAGHARLHAVRRADRGLRRRVPGLRRLEPAALHEDLRRGRA